MAGSGGPWGGGSSDDEGERPEDRGNPRPRGPRRPGEPAPLPEIDELMRKGQEKFRVLMGGKGRGGFGGPGTGGGGPMLTRNTLLLGGLAAVALWSFASFYTVKPEERSVELMFGRATGTIGQPGLNFAPWPVVTAEIVQTTGERTTDVGTGQDGVKDSGLMLTRDQNIVDVEFQVVWNVSDPEKFLFNLADPAGTIKAVSESAMRDIIARSELAPILNRDRGVIAADLRAGVQATLDSYQSGINIVRVNFNRADPPREVIDSFRQVQAAQQERDRLQKQADAYANRVTAGARGEAAKTMEDAEAYRAEVVNNAQGEASRFSSVYAEYVKAPEVTRRRMYLETMERVLGNMNKVILDGVEGQGGVVPYLPLDQLTRTRPAATSTPATGGTN